MVIPPPKLHKVTDGHQLTPAQIKSNAANAELFEKMKVAGIDPTSFDMVPFWILLCIEIGTLGLLAAALILRFYNSADGLYNSSQAYAKGASESTYLAYAIGTSVISQFETSWLQLLKTMEVATTVAPGLTEAQVDELDKKILEEQAKVDKITGRVAAAERILNDFVKAGWEDLALGVFNYFDESVTELEQANKDLVVAVKNKDRDINAGLAASYEAMGYAKAKKT